jgi:hypothetical protein
MIRQKTPTVAPGRPGIWQVHNSCGVPHEFYLAPKGQFHLELSAAIKHMFGGRFETAVLAEDHQKNIGDEELPEMHQTASVYAMQYSADTHKGGHAKHARKSEAKTERATGITTTGSARASAAIGAGSKHASYGTGVVEPFSGLSNVRSTSTRDTAQGQQREHAPQTDTSTMFGAAPTTAHRSPDRTTYRPEYADAGQQRGSATTPAATYVQRDKSHSGISLMNFKMMFRSFKENKQRQ